MKRVVAAVATTSVANRGGTGAKPAAGGLRGTATGGRLLAAIGKPLTSIWGGGAAAGGGSAAAAAGVE